MTLTREPRIEPVPVLSLRPTQITVGLREVEEKRKSWRHHPERERSEFLGKHLIPVVRGPKERHYIIDHHHLALALHREGVKHVAITVVADLRTLPRDAFWIYLDNRGWLHPFDEKGRRRGYESLPKRITDLIDDPYRSLAGELRLAGGYSKETTPFCEFLWAEFLRRRIGRGRLKEDFDAALRAALKLAHSNEAEYLPGWCGATERS
jgi:hypothetical protein